MSDWTAERIELLRVLVAQGLSAAQIARKLGGVSRCAVIGKVNRIGLALAHLPHAPRHEHKVQRPKARVFRSSGHPQPPQPAPPPPEEPPVMNPTPLIKAVYGQCRFPLWGDDLGDRTFPVCGNPVSAGSYCTHHARICSGAGTYSERAAHRGIAKDADVSEAA